MRNELLGLDILHIDETRVQVLKEPDRRAGSASYMWLFASAECERPLYLFAYHPTRAKSVVSDFLSGWAGTVITDGYAAYEDLGPFITRVSCIVHIRRKFADIIKGLDKATLATLPGIVSQRALILIDEIIGIDNSFDGLKSDERKRRRLDELKPKMEAFLSWCRKRRDEAMPSMALSKALNYALSQWPALMNALGDGRLPLDNNRAERSIRPFAIGRKNWLFSDTQRGAHASAALYSIITTAKGCGLKPREYLEWLFTEMPNTENIEDATVLMRFLPWSNEVPRSCYRDPAAVSGIDPLDEPIIDIDPDLLDEDN
jgi:hypothetical protein